MTPNWANIFRLQFLGLIFLVLGLQSNAQDLAAPLLTCIEVQLDGSITISWDSSNDPNGEFNFYQLTRQGPTDPIPLAIEQFTNVTDSFFLDDDASVDGNNNSYCYQLSAVSSTPNTPQSSSETLCSILLDAQADTPVGFVDMNWNDPVPPDSEVPAGTNYELLREYPVGNWEVFATLPYEPGLTNYSYEISVCSALVNFRVDLRFPGASCASASNIVALNVTDTQAPEIPTITSVYVDTLSGNAVVDWNSVSAPDCGGYQITNCNTNLIVGYVTCAEESIYEFLNSNAQFGPESFLIASQDTCPAQNTSPTELLCPGIQTTMFLTNSWTTCQDFVDLEWTEYTGWGDDGVAFYEIFRSEDGSDFSLIGQVDPDDDFFRDNNIQNDIDYCYYVKAYSATINSAESISNIQCTFIAAPPQPATFNLTTATVTGKAENTIIVNTASTTTFFDYVLLRKGENDPFFQEIDNQISNTLNSVVFTDIDVDPTTFYYDYLIGLVNQCGDTVAYSNLGRTIQLDGLANSESLVNTIRWNSYEDWTNGVASYEIYRSVDGGPFDLISVNNAGIRYYEDDVSDQLQSKGEFCYYVKAIEASGVGGTPAESNSNCLCLVQPPKIWIPNAFAINGINNTFFPTISFADLETFRMTIYSRWGQEIFTSLDIDEGWDGTKDGNLIQEGNYMYYIAVKDGSGRIYDFRGPVTMLIFDAN